MGSKPTVTVVPDPDALADAAARLIAEAAADAIEARGRFMWALAGGETPRATYARLALPPFAGRVGAASIPQRLTLTLPVLNAAARVVFLVAGAEKAKVVKAVIGERATLPAAMVQPDHGELVWLLDRAAAAQLAAAERG